MCRPLSVLILRTIHRSKYPDASKTTPGFRLTKLSMTGATSSESRLRRQEFTANDQSDMPIQLAIAKRFHVPQIFCRKTHFVVNAPSPWFQKSKMSGRNEDLSPIHTGCISRFAHKFTCKPFDVACNLCEHSRLLQCVP